MQGTHGKDTTVSENIQLNFYSRVIAYNGSGFQTVPGRGIVRNTMLGNVPSAIPDTLETRTVREKAGGIFSNVGNMA